MGPKPAFQPVNKYMAQVEGFERRFEGANTQNIFKALPKKWRC
jgi:hypothetical protein